MVLRNVNVHLITPLGLHLVPVGTEAPRMSFVLSLYYQDFSHLNFQKRRQAETFQWLFMKQTRQPVPPGALSGVKAIRFIVFIDYMKNLMYHENCRFFFTSNNFFTVFYLSKYIPLRGLHKECSLLVNISLTNCRNPCSGTKLLKWLNTVSLWSVYATN